MLALLIATVFLMCYHPGVQALSCLDAQGKATPGQAFNPLVTPSQEVPGSCNIVIDRGKDHNLQGIYFSDTEQISHLSKNGKSRHKGALVLTRGREGGGTATPTDGLGELA